MLEVLCQEGIDHETPQHNHKQIYKSITSYSLTSSLFCTPLLSTKMKNSGSPTLREGAKSTPLNVNCDSVPDLMHRSDRQIRVFFHMGGAL